MAYNQAKAAIDSNQRPAGKRFKVNIGFGNEGCDCSGQAADLNPDAIHQVITNLIKAFEPPTSTKVNGVNGTQHAKAPAPDKPTGRVLVNGNASTAQESASNDSMLPIRHKEVERRVANGTGVPGPQPVPAAVAPVTNTRARAEASSEVRESRWDVPRNATRAAPKVPVNFATSVNGVQPATRSETRPIASRSPVASEPKSKETSSRVTESASKAAAPVVTQLTPKGRTPVATQAEPKPRTPEVIEPSPKAATPVVTQPTLTERTPETPLPTFKQTAPVVTQPTVREKTPETHVPVCKQATQVVTRAEPKERTPEVSEPLPKATTPVVTRAEPKTRTPEAAAPKEHRPERFDLDPKERSGEVDPPQGDTFVSIEDRMDEDARISISSDAEHPEDDNMDCSNPNMDESRSHANDFSDVVENVDMETDYIDLDPSSDPPAEPQAAPVETAAPIESPASHRSASPMEDLDFIDLTMTSPPGSPQQAPSQMQLPQTPTLAHQQSATGNPSASHYQDAVRPPGYLKPEPASRQDLGPPPFVASNATPNPLPNPLYSRPPSNMDMRAHQASQILQDASMASVQGSYPATHPHAHGYLNQGQSAYANPAQFRDHGFYSNPHDADPSKSYIPMQSPAPGPHAVVPGQNYPVYAPPPQQTPNASALPLSPRTLTSFAAHAANFPMPSGYNTPIVVQNIFIFPSAPAPPPNNQRP